MMDFHCHLDLYENPSEIINKSIKAGVYILSVTTTPKAFPGTRTLAQEAPRIRTALGFHPELVHERFNELKLFDLMITETAYIGEIGLDGSRAFKSHMSLQMKVFSHILKCSHAHGGRVLSIHSRNASSQVIRTLSDEVKSNLPILHWFSGSLDELDQANQLGCWYSVGHSMLSTAKGRAIVCRMPKERLLLETDGPFTHCKGVPLVPQDADKLIPNLAKIWNYSEHEVRMQLKNNIQQIGKFASKVM